MRLLVTGGSGLVGSEIPEDYPRVITPRSSHFDLRCSNMVDHLFNVEKPTHVIHCAGLVGGLKANMARQHDFFVENLLMNTLVMNEAVKRGIENFVTVTSTCVFPDNPRYPLTADQILDGPPHNSNYGYSYAKRMPVVQARAVRDQHGLNYGIAIPCNIYGPNDHFEGDGNHVVPALIKKCWQAKQDETDFVVWGSGAPLREFVYSKDVANILRIMVERYACSGLTEPIIISPDAEHTIGDIARMIAKEMEFEGRIRFDTSMPDGQFKKPSRANFKLIAPGYQLTPLEEGLAETIKAFIQREETAHAD